MDFTTQETKRRRLLQTAMLLAAVCMALGGCSDDGSQVVLSTANNQSADAGIDGGEPDARQDTGGVAQRPLRPGSQLCSAGGTARGAGMVVHTCFAPVETATPVLRGDGYKLEAGAFRMLSP